MSSHPQASLIIAQTRVWLEQLVLAHQLCPFAHKPYQAGQVRFVVTDAVRPSLLLVALKQELELLKKTPPEQIETTLLIHPAVLTDFLAYNDFLDTVDDFIFSEGLEGIIQIASFHPQYQFSGTQPDDAENYTNRSPFPMLHLLREASIERALAHYPDADEIPERNIATMNRLGSAELKRLLQGLPA